MAVQVQGSQGRRRDLFDVLLGGLQAASAFTNIQRARAELDQIPETQARMRRQEENQFALQFKEAKPEQPGAISLEAPTGKKGLYLPRVNDYKSAEEMIQRKQNSENALRREWLTNPLTKTTQEVSVAAGKVRDVGSSEPSPAGDLSLVFNYMKLLDPASTVREGEFANAQNATGAPNQVRNFYNRVMSGERLNPDQRRDFVQRANQLYKIHLERQKDFNEQFRDLAKRQDLDPNNVVLDLKFTPPRSTSLLPNKNQPTEEQRAIINRNFQRILDKNNQPTQSQGFNVDEFLREP